MENKKCYNNFKMKGGIFSDQGSSEKWQSRTSFERF